MRDQPLELSIVIICWNDLKVISDSVSSIFAHTRKTSFEVIVSDNGSTDGSPEHLERHFPKVRLIRNAANLGFAKGNNVGIRASRGEFVLILNPDTIIHEGALDRWVDFANRHPKAGGFGCRVLNADGSYQATARPFPTVMRDLSIALNARFLGRLSRRFSDAYEGWRGDTEREVDWQSGCCVMFRSEILRQLGGFDEQFFYTNEETDLCFRIRQAGYPILFTPEAVITHLQGQSVKRSPLRFHIEAFKNRYRYFYKHYGTKAVVRYRLVWLLGFGLRQLAFGALNLASYSERRKERIEMWRALRKWNQALDPVRFVERGEEPTTDGASATPVPTQPGV